MYDNTCKLLAEKFKDDFVSWMFGNNRGRVKLLPTELTVEALRADSLIMLVRDNIILHLEFQTSPDEKMPSRMANYWFRLHSKYPKAEIRQVVIYLQETTSKLVNQNIFSRSGMRLEFEVIKLWERPVSELLEFKGLLPLAVLARTDDRISTLREISSRIDAIEDKNDKSNLAAATSVLAGLVLEKEVIGSVIREETMQESVIYQDIKKKGLEEGLQRGREEGLLEGRRLEASTMVLRLLKRRIGQISDTEEVKINALSVDKLEALGDALLDFQTAADLTNWLANN